MARFLKFCGVALIGVTFSIGGFSGCTPKPSTEENSKLDEARAAAESAERKLSELRMERINLEKQLEGTATQEQSEKQELKEVEEEDQGEQE